VENYLDAIVSNATYLPKGKLKLETKIALREETKARRYLFPDFEFERFLSVSRKKNRELSSLCRAFRAWRNKQNKAS
jgi:hypothetical protein